MLRPQLSAGVTIERWLDYGGLELISWVIGKFTDHGLSGG